MLICPLSWTCLSYYHPEVFASMDYCPLNLDVGAVGMERGWQSIFRGVMFLLHCCVTSEPCAPFPCVYLWWKSLSSKNDLLPAK